MSKAVDCARGPCNGAESRQPRGLNLQVQAAPHTCSLFEIATTVHSRCLVARCLISRFEFGVPRNRRRRAGEREMNPLSQLPRYVPRKRRPLARNCEPSATRECLSDLLFAASLSLVARCSNTRASRPSESELDTPNQTQSPILHASDPLPRRPKQACGWRLHCR